MTNGCTTITDEWTHVVMKQEIRKYKTQLNNYKPFINKNGARDKKKNLSYAFYVCNERFWDGTKTLLSKKKKTNKKPQSRN